jgi:ABC-2 type transport system permease protein
MKNILQRYNYSIILLKELVKTDFKLRYQGSILGYLWSLLRPLAIFLIMYIVFMKFLRFDYGVPHSTVYLLLGIVLWNYFTEVTSGSVGAIVGKGDLLRKINFPKYVVVLAGSFGALINLSLNFIVIGIFMFVNKVDVSLHILWAIPLIIELFVFALAIAFMLSALFVKLRDVGYIWEVVMQGMFYAVPIFYPLTDVPTRAAKILVLNPVAQIIQDMRNVVITSKTPTIESLWQESYIRILPVLFVLVMAFVSFQYFRKRSKFFAEEV